MRKNRENYWFCGCSKGSHAGDCFFHEFPRCKYKAVATQHACINTLAVRRALSMSFFFRHFVEGQLILKLLKLPPRLLVCTMFRSQHKVALSVKVWSFLKCSRSELWVSEDALMVSFCLWPVLFFAHSTLLRSGTFLQLQVTLAKISPSHSTSALLLSSLAFTN